MKTEHDLMRDFDSDKYVKSYCSRNQCEPIEFDSNGEPSCYGCEGLDKRIRVMYLSILRRRMHWFSIKEWKSYISKTGAAYAKGK